MMHVVKGQGEPIVFVHGNGSNHRTWAHVIAALDRHATCIAYDLRGHSPSAGVLGDPTIEEFVRDLENLRTEMGLARFGLVGQSLGAFIAAAYALRHPDRLSGVALLAAPAGRNEAERCSVFRLIERFRKEGVKQVMPDLVRAWYSESFIAAHPEAVLERLAQIATLDDDVFIRTYALYNETEIGPWLERIQVPTMVMTGEFAKGCDATSARLAAARIPGSRLVVVEGARNGLLTETPDRVAAELRSFFSI